MALSSIYSEAVSTGLSATDRWRIENRWMIPVGTRTFRERFSGRGGKLYATTAGLSPARADTDHLGKVRVDDFSLMRFPRGGRSPKVASNGDSEATGRGQHEAASGRFMPTRN